MNNNEANKWGNNDEEEGEVPKQRQTSALKSGIHRLKVRQHKFNAPKKTDEELFNSEAQIRAGPEFKTLNADDDQILVERGDGEKKLIQDFSCFSEVLQKNLIDKGYEEPTQIQKCVIPIILKKKTFDMLARSPTGSGKTAAFILPMIHLLEKRKQKQPQEILGEECAPNVIVIAPTRELAQQLADSTRTFMRGTSLKVVCTYGEVNVWESVQELKKGCDIFVATIGRLKQFVEEGKITLNNLFFLVLDEADRLLMDHIAREHIRQLDERAKQHSNHRILMFSATINQCVQEFASQILGSDYFFVSVAVNCALPPTVEQEFFEFPQNSKFVNLEEILKEMRTRVQYTDKKGVSWHRLEKKVLIFCNNRRRTNWLALKLCIQGFKAYPTNGDRTQKQRQEALNELENGDCDILVSTNVTSRGLNIFGVGLVVNYEMPKRFEEFVHRTGRTGRAGNAGRAISMIDPDNKEDQILAADLGKALLEMGKELPEALVKYVEE